MESTAWNPESKNLLDPLTYGAILITDFQNSWVIEAQLVWTTTIKKRHIQS